MKSASPESCLKFVQAAKKLLRCPELQREDVSEATHRLIEDVLESSNQVRRECEFPERADIIKYFSKRYAEEDRELLVKRIVSMVSAFPNDALYSSYEEAQDPDGAGGTKKRPNKRPPSKKHKKK